MSDLKKKEKYIDAEMKFKNDQDLNQFLISMGLQRFDDKKVYINHKKKSK